MMREGWVEIELDKACDICDHLRKPINSKERKKRIEGKKSSDLYPYYGATGQVGFIDDYLTDGEYVLIGEDGAPFFDHTKNIAYMINGKTWVNNHAHILLSKFNNKFLLHYLNQFNFKGFVSGTTRLKLTQGSLKKIPVKLAPLPEQRAIVAKIEKLFSDLDNGIANLKTAKAKLEIYRQAVLKKAFEGTPHATKMNLGEINQKIQIGPFGSQLHKEDYIIGGIPLINPMHIQNGEIRPSLSYSISTKQKAGLPNYILQEGDVIMGRRGEMGRCALVTETEDGWFCGTGSLYLRPLKDKIFSPFLYYYMSSPVIKELLTGKATGTTMMNLNKKIISNLPIQLPPLQEQIQIVMEIESRLSVCDKLAESIDQSLEKAEALRQSILKKAFAGQLLSEAELAACRREPDWEPAHKLLERIKNKSVGAKNATTGKSWKANNI